MQLVILSRVGTFVKGMKHIKAFSSLQFQFEHTVLCCNQGIIPGDKPYSLFLTLQFIITELLDGHLRNQH